MRLAYPKGGTEKPQSMISKTHVSANAKMCAALQVMIPLYWTNGRPGELVLNLDTHGDAQRRTRRGFARWASIAGSEKYSYEQQMLSVVYVTTVSAVSSLRKNGAHRTAKSAPKAP